MRLLETMDLQGETTKDFVERVLGCRLEAIPADLIAFARVGKIVIDLTEQGFFIVVLDEIFPGGERETFVASFADDKSVLGKVVEDSRRLEPARRIVVDVEADCGLANRAGFLVAPGIGAWVNSIAIF